MPTLATYFHDLSGVVLPISGDFAIRWYGLSYVTGFLAAWTIWFWLSKRKLTPIPSYRVMDAVMLVILGTLLGGRLGYALVYDPKLIISVHNTFPFWDLLAINKGGMASHGGMIGLTIAAWFVARGFKPQTPGADLSIREGSSSTLHVMDLIAFVSPFGIFLGRCANFVNGELLGAIIAKPGQPAPWYAVRFPHELLGWLGPNLREAHSHTPDLTFEQATSLDKLVASVQATNEPWADALRRIVASAAKYKDQLEPLLSARHPSQLYQALAEGLILGLITWWIWAKPRKPGVVVAWWLIIYGLLRIVTEFWRLPDPQFSEGRPLGLSRGQWLSAAMVAIGIGLLIYASRRAQAKIGGWLSRATDHGPA